MLVLRPNGGNCHKRQSMLLVSSKQGLVEGAPEVPFTRRTVEDNPALDNALATEEDGASGTVAPFGARKIGPFARQIPKARNRRLSE